MQESITLFFEQNPNLDLKNISLIDEREIDFFSWQKLEDKKKQIVSLLKKYQRLLRIIDDKEIAKGLLSVGIHSAYQIASFPKDIFLERFETLFNSSEEAIKAYEKAKKRRDLVMLNYYNKKEANSPYLKASKFFN